MKTRSQIQLDELRKWCGNDVSLSVDADCQDGEGKFIEFDIKCDTWEQYDDLCSKGSIKRNGYRIVSIFNYEASRKIAYGCSAK